MRAEDRPASRSYTDRLADHAPPQRDLAPTQPAEGFASCVARFDGAVDRLFDPLRGNRAADWIFYVASEGADYSRAWHAINAVMAAVSPSRRRDTVRLATMLAIESILVNGVIKQLTGRERPPQLADRSYEVRRPRTKSFPSGHASSATLTAVLLSDAVPRLRPLWVALATVVSASRIHNRMHHGSDVVAGAALGGAFGVAARTFWPLR